MNSVTLFKVLVDAIKANVNGEIINEIIKGGEVECQEAIYIYIDNGRSLLTLALVTARVEIAISLLENGADPNDADGFGDTGFMLARKRFQDLKNAGRILTSNDPNIRIFAAMLERGLFIEPISIITVCDLEDEASMRTLVTMAKAFPGTQLDVLTMPIDEGMHEAVQMMVDVGIDVNEVGADGKTAALHAANAYISVNRPEYRQILQTLRDAGANLDIHVSNGLTIRAFLDEEEDDQDTEETDETIRAFLDEEEDEQDTDDSEEVIEIMPIE